MKIALAAALVGTLMAAAPAHAEDPLPPEEPPVLLDPLMSVEVDSDHGGRVLVGEKKTFTITLKRDVSTPLPGRQLAWSLNSQAPKQLTTNTAGQAKFSYTPTATGADRFTVVFQGDEEYAPASINFTVKPKKADVRVRIAGKKKVVDEKGTAQTVKVNLETGKKSSSTVKLVLRQKGMKKRVLKGELKKGEAVFKFKTYRPAKVTARVAGNRQHKFGKTTKKLGFKAAGKKIKVNPKPRIKLPKQKLATTSGANVRITPIPNKVWKNMRGKSWRPGCTPRSKLRLVRTNYWSFDGFRRQGELIVAASIAHKYRAALNGIYAAKLPLRSMYRVDRFGYSKYLHGADDYKSMAAGNTSAFNCRGVVGNPRVKSPHATGRSFDLNPWENPYLSRLGWTPNSVWIGKSHPLVAWRSGNHKMVKVMKKAGFRWTYGIYDAHHFDG